MSNTALLPQPTTVRRHLRAVEDLEPTPLPAPAAAPALPPGTAPRGFALYVGIDEAKAGADGVSLSTRSQSTSARFSPSRCASRSIGMK